jgi:hypothetical protein
MITKDKLDYLRGLVYTSKVVDGRAIVELTTDELRELIKDVDQVQALLQDTYDTLSATACAGERLPHITLLLAKLNNWVSK